MATAAASDQRRMAFKPVDFDAENIPPDLPAGEWTAKCSVKVSSTSKDNYPMLILEWKVLEATDEDQESFVGSTATDFLSFFPESEGRSGRMSKQQLQALCEMIDYPLADIPKRIESEDDFDELIAAIEEDKHTIWTTVRTDREGQERTNVRYRAPKGGLTLRPDEEPEEEPEEPEEEPEEPEEPAEPEPETRSARARRQTATEPEPRTQTRTRTAQTTKGTSREPARNGAARRNRR